MQKGSFFLAEFLAQLFHKEVSRWTIEGIFNGQMVNLVNLFAVGVGKFPAGLRAQDVNRTKVIRP